MEVLYWKASLPKPLDCQLPWCRSCVTVIIYKQRLSKLFLEVDVIYTAISKLTITPFDPCVAHSLFT